MARTHCTGISMALRGVLLLIGALRGLIYFFLYDNIVRFCTRLGNPIWASKLRRSKVELGVKMGQSSLDRLESPGLVCVQQKETWTISVWKNEGNTDPKDTSLILEWPVVALGALRRVSGAI
ncbi:unnamed protein product [Penicillium egyptiacum]|uniref:Uncharacterized protein n=1 Tax=Penicillium egyptiacum TaxID=1303716 RepID=A0A9W4P419_9EURO|nr:unnamed protein product [Penicillium egyptiacum]